jgi:hypothetical protein
MTERGDKPTRPDEETRSEERQDAHVPAGADRAPTPDEEELAEQQSLDPEVAKHEREMAERGAHQEGEGRTP